MSAEETKINDEKKQIEGLPTTGIDIREGQTPNLTSSVDRDELNREILKVKDSVTANFVTILGIFASFLAFLIIEIQILKTVCDYLRIMGMSLFILGAILCFVIFLLYFVDSQNKKTKQMALLSSISVLFIVLGIIFVARSPDEYICNMTKLNDDFLNFQQKLQKEQNDWFEQKTILIDGINNKCAN